MRYAIALLAVLTATPALAHHEVVTGASMLPLAGGLAVITIAGLAAWREWRASRK